MAITVTVRTADLDDDGAENDDPIELMTAVHVDVAGLTDHNADGTQRSYRLVVTGPGDDLRSHRFTPSSDGKHTWDGVVFPADGAYNVDVWLIDNTTGAEASSVKTQAVTVVAAS